MFLGVVLGSLIAIATPWLGSSTRKTAQKSENLCGLELRGELEERWINGTNIVLSVAYVFAAGLLIRAFWRVYRQKTLLFPAVPIRSPSSAKGLLVFDSLLVLLGVLMLDIAVKLVFFLHFGFTKDCVVEPSLGWIRFAQVGPVARIGLIALAMGVHVYKYAAFLQFDGDLPVYWGKVGASKFLIWVEKDADEECEPRRAAPVWTRQWSLKWRPLLGLHLPLVFVLGVFLVSSILSLVFSAIGASEPFSFSRGMFIQPEGVLWPPPRLSALFATIAAGCCVLAAFLATIRHVKVDGRRHRRVFCGLLPRVWAEGIVSAQRPLGNLSSRFQGVCFVFAVFGAVLFGSYYPYTQPTNPSTRQAFLLGPIVSATENLALDFLLAVAVALIDGAVPAWSLHISGARSSAMTESDSSTGEEGFFSGESSDSAPLLTADTKSPENTPSQNIIPPENTPSQNINPPENINQRRKSSAPKQIPRGTRVPVPTDTNVCMPRDTSMRSGPALQIAVAVLVSAVVMGKGLHTFMTGASAAAETKPDSELAIGASCDVVATWLLATAKASAWGIDALASITLLTGNRSLMTLLQRAGFFGSALPLFYADWQHVASASYGVLFLSLVHVAAHLGVAVRLIDDNPSAVTAYLEPFYGSWGSFSKAHFTVTGFALLALLLLVVFTGTGCPRFPTAMQCRPASRFLFHAFGSVGFAVLVLVFHGNDHVFGGSPTTPKRAGLWLFFAAYILHLVRTAISFTIPHTGLFSARRSSDGRRQVQFVPDPNRPKSSRTVAYLRSPSYERGSYDTTSTPTLRIRLYNPLFGAMYRPGDFVRLIRPTDNPWIRYLTDPFRLETARAFTVASVDRLSDGRIVVDLIVSVKPGDRADPLRDAVSWTRNLDKNLHFLFSDIVFSSQPELRLAPSLLVDGPTSHKTSALITSHRPFKLFLGLGIGITPPLVAFLDALRHWRTTTGIKALFWQSRNLDEILSGLHVLLDTLNGHTDDITYVLDEHQDESSEHDPSKDLNPPEQQGIEIPGHDHFDAIVSALPRLGTHPFVQAFDTCLKHAIREQQSTEEGPGPSDGPLLFRRAPIFVFGINYTGPVQPQNPKLRLITTLLQRLSSYPTASPSHQHIRVAAFSLSSLRIANGPISFTAHGQPDLRSNRTDMSALIKSFQRHCRSYLTAEARSLVDADPLSRPEADIGVCGAASHIKVIPQVCEAFNNASADSVALIPWLESFE